MAKKTCLLTLALCVFLTSISVHAAKDDRVKRCYPAISFAQMHCWYAGGGFSLTRLNPEPLGETLWRVDDAQSSGLKLLIGLSLSDHWFAELSYENLGKAGLKHLNTNLADNTDTVPYYAFAASGGYWLQGTPEQWDVYVKAGLAKLTTSTDETYVYQDHPNQVFFGLGAVWCFTHNWSSRLELTSYDKDAKSLGLTLTRRFGNRAKSFERVVIVPPVVIKKNQTSVVKASKTSPQPSTKTITETIPNSSPKPSPKPSPKLEPSLEAGVAVVAQSENAIKVKKLSTPKYAVVASAVVESAVVTKSTTVVVAEDKTETIEEVIALPDDDADGVENQRDKCSDTPIDKDVDARGCLLLRSVNINVQFDPNRAVIADKTLPDIQDVIDAIHILGDVHITVEGHTDWKGSQEANKPLSELRAAVVADLLQKESGLPKDNFTVVGFGELNPVADNTTEEGRLKNRRVVIIISQHQ